MIFKQIKTPFLYTISGILGLSALLTTPALVCMDDPRTPQKTSVVYNPDIQPTITNSLKRALEADQANVAVDSFILTDTKIINLLSQIQKKHPDSVTVHVHDKNSHNKKTIKTLQDAGITVNTSALHTKRVSIAFKQFHETKWHKHTITGSYNLTANAAKNKEIMVVEINDSPGHKAHTESHNQGIKRDRTKIGSQVIDTTPQNKTVIDNVTHDLHASLAQRIKNTEAGDILYVASMNYGNTSIHKALLAAVQRNVLLYLLLDADATAHKNIPLLDELDQHGAQIVFPTGTIKTKENIKIFDKNGIFHQKYVVRVRGKNMLTYISTANATEHAQKDFNVSTFYPNQDAMAQNIITTHQKLAQKGITYQAYKASGAKLPIRKKAQKKLSLSDSSHSDE